MGNITRETAGQILNGIRRIEQLNEIREKIIKSGSANDRCDISVHLPFAGTIGISKSAMVQVLDDETIEACNALRAAQLKAKTEIIE